MIDRDLARRQGGYGHGGKMQIKRDQIKITSGVIDGKPPGVAGHTTQHIENKDWENWREHWAG